MSNLFPYELHCKHKYLTEPNYKQKLLNTPNALILVLGFSSLEIKSNLKNIVVKDNLNREKRPASHMLDVPGLKNIIKFV